jgi:drug/metabolite transporter (DMT)-like permease
LNNTRLKIILSFFAIYVVWGSTYLFNKIAVTELPPFFLASIRFTIAGLLMVSFATYKKASFKITKRELLNCCIAGFLFLIYGNSVYIWALQFVDSGIAALIAATQPLFVLLLMRIFFKKQIKTKSIIGILLGVFGMYLLVSQQNFTSNSKSIWGMLAMLTCVLSWASGSVFVSKARLPSNFMVSTGIQMLFSGFILALLSLLFKESWSSPLVWTQEVQFSMVFLIVFGGVVAFTAFNYLLKKVSTEKVATSAYVNPVIALAVGWYYLNEKLSLQSIIASLILLIGVYFITSRKRTTENEKSE